MSSSTVAAPIIYLGLDVHQDSVTIAVLPADAAVKIATEMADALDYAHRQGVIHRDIKPESLLLHDGRPMVVDFGIAPAVSAAAGGRMTETGLSLGTPRYMSPEPATADKQITARSDVYSLAGVVYEMLTGNPPHVGSSAQQIIMKIITEVAAPVTALRKSVPANVAAALSRALEKLPADRFASAKQFADALVDPAFSVGEVQGNRTGSTALSRSPVRRRMWLIEIAGRWASPSGVWMALGGNRRASAPDVSTFLDLALPDSAPLATAVRNLLGNTNRTLTLSSDGRFLVYLAAIRVGIQALALVGTRASRLSVLVRRERLAYIGA